MNKAIIRGIELFAMRDQQALLDFLINEQDVKFGKLVAINAEKVILNEENNEIRQSIADAEYKYADGISIVYSIRKKYPKYRNIERIAGVDLWFSLMKRCASRQIPVFLLGGTAVTLSNTFAKLQTIGVNIVGYQDGYFLESEEDSVIAQIKQSGAKVVTVGLGSPKQELFMQKAQGAYPNALYMGVGGSYDVFIGAVKRAPICWQKLGLEWLYRLLKQPTRWQRQLRLIKYGYYYWKNQL
ncbi:lipopolysaccharide N-acetylmannosaminouronosyltransferase [Vespertiliibacter pulmonis]|uniref:UDP-N-acetyl-D-mannosaminouronate:lipid I N-acetyl-D-mannosaminouronosyltransferase n=1 Tax=Vespertiliibacter pulmonis TaxID=1443036 RepID=A0A3N4VL66_9PAST|nr:lipopolysaccharide N-acetylmannosaminouronosyltransferase [Vespertiliibacter pulmonis]QLB20958.1 lipopolysaccharide N-acetylmannosaminouronosyltransferase [Vespertiliibacter pulmonis]RPE83618.1 UDP-N-acetyl-D-mannosaminouronate:lipid I N-acetyl-D-mannosaminouronosyltransferase [Vespertiliibacter pulmonis]